MIRIIEEPLTDLVAHERIPIAFECTSRLEIDALRRGEFLELPCVPFTKDYDQLERMSEFALGFDTRNWALFGAYENAARLGGILIARDTPSLDLLKSRADLAAILDIRVHPNARGKGAGRALMHAAFECSRAQSCRDIIVETQDINVAACRFYAAMGFVPWSVNEGAYRPALDETQVIWGLALDA